MFDYILETIDCTECWANDTLSVSVNICGFNDRSKVSIDRFLKNLVFSNFLRKPYLMLIPF